MKNEKLDPRIQRVEGRQAQDANRRSSLNGVHKRKKWDYLVRVDAAFTDDVRFLLWERDR